MNSKAVTQFLVRAGNSYREVSLEELKGLDQAMVEKIMICRYVKKGGKITLLTVDDLEDLELHHFLEVVYPTNSNSDIRVRIDTSNDTTGLAAFGWHHAHYEQIGPDQYELLVPEPEFFPGSKH